MKRLLVVLSVLISGVSVFRAQSLPGYVPSGGLVAWWPFNGNVSDVSGNGNNGQNFGAVLVSDRFGINSSAFDFNNGSYIKIPNSASLSVGQCMTISLWVKCRTLDNKLNIILMKGAGGGCKTTGYYLGFDNASGSLPSFVKVLGYGGNNNCAAIQDSSSLNNAEWNQLTIVYSPPVQKIYFNGKLQNGDFTVGSEYAITNSSNPLIIGGNIYSATGLNPFYGSAPWNGAIDDIGIWNRVLTDSEIADLYSCKGLISGQPNNQNSAVGQDAVFSAVLSNNATKSQWQSNSCNLGWQNVTDNESYSGSSSAILRVKNITVSNHHQKFRLIASNTMSADTSVVAELLVQDTCLTSVATYDTLKIKYVSTDAGINRMSGVIRVYPNPAKERLIIESDSFSLSDGLTVSVKNVIGQVVYSSAISDSKHSVTLSSWGGAGLYVLELYDANSRRIASKKIVLE